MNDKLKILVLCGGESPEHEVSLVSGKTCALNFDDKYLIHPVVILKSGKWLFSQRYYDFSEKKIIEDWFNKIIEPKNSDELKSIENKSLPIYDAIEKMHNDRPDLVFIILHGPRGEDGTIQGFFDFLRLPYIGSNVLASSLGMDKHRFQKLLDYHGIKIPKHVVLYEYQEFSEDVIKEIEEKIGYPCFVKPSRCGSSVGMGIVRNKQQLIERIDDARNYDREVLIEEYIKGTEVTCGIINCLGENDTDNVIVFQPTEIIPKEAEFFDYTSKYTTGKSEEITPARLPKEKIDEIRILTEKVFRIAGASGLSRVDIIIRDDIPYVLEINTIPGMTPVSLLPQGAKAAGYSFSQLLDNIVKFSLKIK